MRTTPTTPAKFAYEHAARRHWADAETLFSKERMANAGQLFGFVAECGLKALLLACGVAPDSDGGIPKKHHFRQHMPNLTGRIATHGHLIPDGPQAANYMAILTNLGDFIDWSVDDRYCRDAAFPKTTVAKWHSAAKEVSTMLDQAKLDGVL